MTDHPHTPVDHTAMTDEELAECQRGALIEQERRERLASLPAQIAALTAQYLADGGDPSALPTPKETTP